MGNLLCKKNRSDRPMSPVDHVIGRCAQICPQNLGKKKHFWDRQVLETSPPPLSQQPKLGSQNKEDERAGWETVNLTVPDGPANGSVPPVAPPRKKRPSMSPKNEIFRKMEQNIIKQDHDENENNRSDTQKVELEEEKVLDVQVNSEENKSDKGPSSSVKIEEDPSSPIKTPSHIGNEKSDKFFGVKLSDTLSSTEGKEKQIQLSETDGISSGKDEVDNAKYPKNIAQNDNNDVNCEVIIVEETDEMLRKIKKEKGNLIFALEKQLNKEEYPEYEGKIPVVEEIIVPVKRKERHICDDEECLHKLLHNTPAPDPAAPRKPQRDFTKYKKSVENFKSQEVSDSSQNKNPNNPNNAETRMETISTENLDLTPIRCGLTKQDEKCALEVSDDLQRKPLLPQEFLISEIQTSPADKKTSETPPPIPPKLKKKFETPPVSNESESLERSKRKSEIVAPNMSNSEKILRRCLSSQSYLTPDLVEKIAQQANSLSLTALYLPEDYSSFCNDGSGLVSPSSKLTAKRQLSSQISRTSQAKSDDDRISESDSIIEDQIEKTDEIIVSVVKQETFPKLTQEINLENDIAPTSETVEKEDGQKPKKRISVKTSSPEEISNAIRLFLDKNDLTPKNVLQLLEDEFGELLHSKNIAPEDMEVLEQLRKSAAACEDTFAQTKRPETVELSSKQIDSENEAETLQNKIATLESNAKLTKSCHYSKIPKLKNKTLDAISSGDKRRHSIDEMESWFSLKSDKEDVTDVKRRRESSLPNCLDSPDGERKDFSLDGPRKETVCVTESKNEHSSLLKFLENEKNNY